MMVENDNFENTGQGSVEESQNSCSPSSGDGGDCGCGSKASGGYGKRKWVVFIIILAAAGIILARSFMKESTVVCSSAPQVFAGMGEGKNSDGCPVKGEDCDWFPVKEAAGDVAACEKKEAGLWRSELDSLSSLTKAAGDSDAVFVFLGVDGLEGDRAIEKVIEAAAKKILDKGSGICAFRLKKDSDDYAQLAKQFSVPCVLAMVKGGGMSAASGQIDEAKLVEAFVTASRPSGCGPSGCGPTDACPE